MERLRTAILVLFIVTCQFYMIHGQELNTTQQEYIETIVETISTQLDKAVDLSLLIDNLTYYYSHPLNLNSATSGQLMELYILNEFQVAVIIDYRKRNGPIKTVNELMYLPGFRTHDIELLESFIVIEEPEKRVQINRNTIKYSEHQMIIRYQRVLEKQKGFESVPDSLILLNPEKSRYLGSPDKLYFRYSGSLSNYFKAGIIMEKDAGEDFFSGSNPHGFDFYSAHISYYNGHGIIRNITLGDYIIRWGQGLLLWNGYSFGKSSYTSDIVRKPLTTKGNTSVDENRFLRGAAITLGKDRFRFSAFYSSKLIDANIADSSMGDNLFTGFSETGYHATPTEVLKEKSLRQITAGSSLQYLGNRLKAALNGYYMTFNKSLMESNDLYKVHSYSGKELTGVSADYRYLGGKTQVFGETAYANSSFATINGMLIMPTPEIQIGIIYRYYQKGYYSYFANAFSENSGISNENGLYMGGEFRFAGYRLKMYGDVFTFPWLKYRVNAPSEGFEYFMEIGRKINKSDIYFRYKHQQKPENYFTGDKIFDIRVLLKENYRLNVVYYAGDKFRFQNRFEISRTAFQEENNNFGYLGFQDVSFVPAEFPVELTMRIAYFNASDYNARLYAYEKDVLYAFSSQMYYGEGWRYMAMIKWKAAKFLSVWLKVAQSYYPGEKELGSGLNTIPHNHKTEIKLQAIAKF